MQALLGFFPGYEPTPKRDMHGVPSFLHNDPERDTPPLRLPRRSSNVRLGLGDLVGWTLGQLILLVSKGTEVQIRQFQIGAKRRHPKAPSG